MDSNESRRSRYPSGWNRRGCRPACGSIARVRLGAATATWKRVYPTVTSAWIAAFCNFVGTGRVNARHRCGRSRFARAIARHRVTADPWRFEPFIRWIGSIKHHFHGCGLWHLTSLFGHVLTSEQRVALPKAIGWEASHRPPY